MSKILITGGCSFSECISTNIDTWPRHLAKSLPDYTHVSTAMGSQGNGLISRRVIYEIANYLNKGTHPKDILVCIMWSGPNRFDSYFQKSDSDYRKNAEGWMENPTSFVKENNNKNWYIFNQHWQTRINTIYYKELYDGVMAQIQTLEHILRVQWFLKTNNIDYMMTSYMGHVLENVNHPECKYLYDMIDMDKFLPIKGEYEWCKEKGSLPFPNLNDPHPGTGQHGEFTEKVILPFLKEKGYIA
jgi:hypothetical protein